MEKRDSLLWARKQGKGLGFSLLIVLTLLLAACGGSPPSGNTNAPSNATPQQSTGITPVATPTQPATTNATITVKISEVKGPQGDTYWFEPATISVLPGTTVEWVNESDEEHMLASDTAGIFDSYSMVEMNGTYKKTFDKAGTFAYESTHGPDIKGSVVVQTVPMIDVQVLEKQSAQGDTYWFEPAGVVVKSGTVIEWTNKSDEDHMLSSDKNDLFTTPGEITMNGTYKVTLSTPGIYTYASEKHPDAKGIIIVV